MRSPEMFDSSSYPLYEGARHRTGPEKWVGGAIFLFISFAFFFFNGWVIANEPLLSGPLPSWLVLSCWIAYHAILPTAVWIFWRYRSLLTLKLELSVFFIQLILPSTWFVCFYYLMEPLLSFYVSVFWASSTILGILLFYKKRTLSGILLIPAFVWVVYLMGLNMTLCIHK